MHFWISTYQWLMKMLFETVCHIYTTNVILWVWDANLCVHITYQYPEYFVKNDRIICLMQKFVWEARKYEGIELVLFLDGTLSFFIVIIQFKCYYPLRQPKKKSFKNQLEKNIYRCDDKHLILRDTYMNTHHICESACLTILNIFTFCPTRLTITTNYSRTFSSDNYVIC